MEDRLSALRGDTSVISRRERGWRLSSATSYQTQEVVQRLEHLLCMQELPNSTPKNHGPLSTSNIGLLVLPGTFQKLTKKKSLIAKYLSTKALKESCHETKRRGQK